MASNPLYEIRRGVSLERMKQILKESSIIDKIEFSGISKETIKEKIQFLRETQVPERHVLLDMNDDDVLFYWFKNWLHCHLKSAVPLAPQDKRGCSRERVLLNIEQDMLHFYENGQQNFSYSMADIESWANDQQSNNEGSVK